MRDRFLIWLANLIWRHPISIVVVAAALAVYCGVASWQLLQVNADTNDLISPNRPFMADFNRFRKEFGDTEYIYVVVACPEEASRPRVERCVDALTELLGKIEDLPGVFSGVTPREQLRIASRAMSETELAGFAGALPTLLSGDAGRVIAEADALWSQLITTGTQLNEVEQQRVGATAVLLLDVIAAARPDSASEKELALLLGRSPPTEYFKSETGRLYFITIMPVKDYGTLSVIEEPLWRIRQAIAEVRDQFSGIDIGLTGKPVLQADEMSTTNRDMTLASILAFILCAILFIVMMRDFWRQLLAMTAFMIGSAWTYGAATFMVGQLNLLSIVFMLVLVGVGLDYGTHIIARYKEHRLMGEDVQTALRDAVLNAVRGNITGALTSSSVFFMALFTTFQGLRELGLVAGVGLVLCLIAMSVVLPALIAFLERRHKPIAEKRPFASTSLDTEGVLHLMIKRPGAVLVTAAIITGALVYAPGSLRFEQNLLKLQSVDLESVRWERRIAQDSASNSWFGVVMADDLNRVKAVHDAAASRPTIGAVHSILDVIQLPTPRHEEERSRLQSTAATQPAMTEPAATSPTTTSPPATQPSWSGRDLAQVIDKLNVLAVAATTRAPNEAQLLRRISADLGALERGMQAESRTSQPDALVSETSARSRIERAVRDVVPALRAIVTGDALELRDALPDGLRQQMISPNGRFLVGLHPREDVWEYDAMAKFIADLRAVDPHVTGVPITHFESLGEMLHAFVVMSLLAFGVICAVVAIDFRSVKDVLLAVLPLIIGMIWTVEFMGLFKVSFNLANFFSVPILIGIGVDSSVHILHRYREGGPKRFSLGSTRRAVILTALTTVIGFGCLILAHHRGLRSLGIVMSIGSTACLLSSVIILPALLAWFEKHPPPHRTHL